MRFLFDFISPYSYVAWTRVHALAARHGRTVEPVPVLFAALLDHHGHKGPAEIHAKREHMAKQLLRITAREGIPFAPPPAHPFNPVAALRVACLDHAAQRRIIDVLFDAVWAGGPGVADERSVVSVLDAAGFPGEELVADAKRLSGGLRTHTQQAIELGVFGVPTILVDGELFWGFDSFPDIDAFLSGRDRVDPALLARWRTLPVAAVRGGSRRAASPFRLRDSSALDPLLAALVAAGATVLQRDRASATVRDPDGNEITLSFE